MRPSQGREVAAQGALEVRSVLLPTIKAMNMARTISSLISRLNQNIPAVIVITVLLCKGHKAAKSPSVGPASILTHGLLGSAFAFMDDAHILFIAY